MNILALDTATRTGWAVKSSGVIESGVIDCSIRTKATKTHPKDHEGRRFVTFHVWLRNMIREHNVDLIVYEAVVGGARAGGNTAMIQKGFEAILWLNAAVPDRKDEPASTITPCPVWSFAPATIKKWATGNGTLTHESKAAVVAEAMKEFPDQEFLPGKLGADDNQCDALWILDLALAVLKPITQDVEDMRLIDVDDLTPFANKATYLKWNLRRQAPTKSSSR